MSPSAEWDRCWTLGAHHKRLWPRWTACSLVERPLRAMQRAPPSAPLRPRSVPKGDRAFDRLLVPAAPPEGQRAPSARSRPEKVGDRQSRPRGSGRNSQRSGLASSESRAEHHPLRGRECSDRDRRKGHGAGNPHQFGCRARESYWEFNPLPA